MLCPHCGSEFDPDTEKKGSELRVKLRSEIMVEKGEDIDSGSDLIPDRSGLLSNPDLTRSDRRARTRGKALRYSPEFEIAWKAYRRRQEKPRAYFEWRVQAAIETEKGLLGLVLKALKWQVPMWDAEGWKFAPYFERYLKRRKWEDEPPPAAASIPAPTWLAAQRAEEARRRDEENRAIRANREIAAEIERAARGGAK